MNKTAEAPVKLMTWSNNGVETEVWYRHPGFEARWPDGKVVTAQSLETLEQRVLNRLAEARPFSPELLVNVDAVFDGSRFDIVVTAQEYQVNRTPGDECFRLGRFGGLVPGSPDRGLARTLDPTHDSCAGVLVPDTLEARALVDAMTSDLIATAQKHLDEIANSKENP